MTPVGSLRNGSVSSTVDIGSRGLGNGPLQAPPAHLRWRLAAAGRIGSGGPKGEVPPSFMTSRPPMGARR
jgi:hypothetical protein